MKCSSKFLVEYGFDIKIESEIKDIYPISETKFVAVAQDGIYEINGTNTVLKQPLDLSASTFDYDRKLLIGISSKEDTLIIYNLSDPPRILPNHNSVFAILKGHADILVTIGSEIKIWDYTPDALKLKSVIRSNFSASSRSSFCINNDSLLIPTERGFMSYRFDGTPGKVTSCVFPSSAAVLNGSNLLTSHGAHGLFVWDSDGSKVSEHSICVRDMFTLLPNFVLIVDDNYSVFVMDVSSNSLTQLCTLQTCSFGFVAAKRPFLWTWKEGVLTMMRIKWSGTFESPYQEELKNREEQIVKVVFGIPRRYDRSTSPFPRSYDEAEPMEHPPVEVPKIELPKLAPVRKPTVMKTARPSMVTKKVRILQRNDHRIDISPHVVDMNQILSSRLPSLSQKPVVCFSPRIGKKSWPRSFR